MFNIQYSNKQNLQLDGKIIAPTSPAAWGSGTLQWIEFTELNKITIRGKGVIDGQGSVWWNDSPTYNPTEESETSTSEYSVNIYVYHGSWPK